MSSIGDFSNIKADNFVKKFPIPSFDSDSDEDNDIIDDNYELITDFVKNPSIDALKEILQQDGYFNFSATGKDRWTVLGAALNKRDVELVDYILDCDPHLLKYSYDPYQEGTTLGVRSYLSHAYRASPKILQLFLDRGADVNLLSEEGQTLLDQASRDKNRQLTKTALLRGGVIYKDETKKMGKHDRQNFVLQKTFIESVLREVRHEYENPFHSFCRSLHSCALKPAKGQAEILLLSAKSPSLLSQMPSTIGKLVMRFLPMTQGMKMREQFYIDHRSNMSTPVSGEKAVDGENMALASQRSQESNSIEAPNQSASRPSSSSQLVASADFSSKPTRTYSIEEEMEEKNLALALQISLQSKPIFSSTSTQTAEEPQLSQIPSPAPHPFSIEKLRAILLKDYEPNRRSHKWSALTRASSKLSAIHELSQEELDAEDE